MGEPLVAEPTTPTEQSPLSTNSVAFQSSELPEPETFGLDDVYRAFSYFCDKNSLDKKQVALGLFLSILLIIFSVGTVIAWNRYSPIIQEFIIKENIEKARSKNNEKNKRRMKSFKNFLNKKRVQNHFKNSGEGVRLSDGQSSSSQPSVHGGAAQGGQIDRIAAADVAAQAAFKRMQKNEPPKKNKIEMIVKRQMEEERRMAEELGEQRNTSTSSEPEREIELEHSSAITKVMFSSELLGEDHVRSKQELLKDIEVFLKEQVHESDDENDKVMAAILMLYSLNKTDVKEKAIATICTYCGNILQNPEENKFKSIRVANKNFQEKVASAIGGRLFLEAIGFTEQIKDGEQFLIFTKSSDTHLVDALDALKDGQSVPIKVARCLQLEHLKKGEKPKAPKLSNDFFNLTTAELKAEQKAKEVQVEKMLTLRTKEMRLKDEQSTNYRYKYTLIRVRLPNDIIIQGIFGCQEPFSAVRQFVSSVLSPSLLASEYSLRDAVGQVVDDESATLAQLSLAPAAILHLDFAENPSETEELIAEQYLHLLTEQLE